MTYFDNLSLSCWAYYAAAGLNKAVCITCIFVEIDNINDYKYQTNINK